MKNTTFDVLRDPISSTSHVKKLSFNPEQIQNFRNIASVFCRASSIPGRSKVVSSAYSDIFASLVFPDLKMGIPFTAGSFLIRIATNAEKR